MYAIRSYYVSQWAKGRGDWMVAALRWTRTEQEAIVRGAVSDPKSLNNIAYYLKLQKSRFTRNNFV